MVYIISREIKKQLLLVICCFFFANTILAGDTVGKNEISLNGYWEFKTIQNFKDAEALVHPDTIWKNSDSLLVPGNWDTEQVYAEYQGMAIYRKTIDAPASWSKDVIRIQFGAVYETAYIYVNGHFIGKHVGGYTPFEFRIDDVLHAGKSNTVAVVVDNSYRRGAWWPWGGISRGVSLIKNNAVRVQKLKVSPEVDIASKKGKVDIEYYLENNSVSKSAVQIQVKIFEKNNNQKFLIDTSYSVTLDPENYLNNKISLQLPQTIKLWDINNPNRYSCDVILKQSGKNIDQKKVLFGFRKVQIIGQQLFLNGESVRLVGFNRVHDHRAVGNTEPFWLIKKDLDHMKSLGCNMTRMMHAPLSPEILDYADEIGMLIIGEIPVWGIGDTQAFENNPLTKHWLKEMVDRDFNHPSVIGWSMANELALDNADRKKLSMSREQSQYVISMMKYVREELDSTRLVTYVSYTNFRDIDPAIEPANYADFICFNSYGDFVELSEIIHNRWPNKAIFISEFGQGQVGYQKDDMLDLRILDRLKRVAKLPYVIGASLWTYNDYRSDYKGTPLGGDRTWGVVDVWRKPKKAADQIQKAFAPIETLNVYLDKTESNVLASIKARTQTSLPYYTLRNFKLVLQLFDKSGDSYYQDSILLKNIYPDGNDLQYKFQLSQKLSKATYLIVSLVTSTNHSVYQKVVYNNVPSKPEINHVFTSDSVVRLYFKTLLPDTHLIIDLPENRTIKTSSNYIDISKEKSQNPVKALIYTANANGKSKAINMELKFLGKLLSPVIREAMQVEDGIVVGYTNKLPNSQYRIQYKKAGGKEILGELSSSLEGSSKIKTSVAGAVEVRIREETKAGNSQWSPWQPVIDYRKN